MKKHIIIGIGIGLLLAAVGGHQYSAAQLGIPQSCTNYKLKVFDITNTEQFKLMNSFIEDKSVRKIAGVITRYADLSYITYCLSEKPICKNQIHVIPGSQVGTEVEEKVNTFAEGKTVIDTAFAYWENRIDAFILYCASPVTQPQSAKTPEVEAKPPIKIEKKELVLSEPSKISQGDLIGIQAAVSNEIPLKMNFTYIVQIKDEFAATVFLTWVQDLSVLQNDSVKPTIFWLPENEGKYRAEVFVWDSVDNAVPLAPTKSLTFEVG